MKGKIDAVENRLEKFEERVSEVMKVVPAVANDVKWQQLKIGDAPKISTS